MLELDGPWSSMADALIRRQSWKGKGTQGEHQLQAKERQRLPESHRDLGRWEEGFSHVIQREHDPADTWISDFKPPELWDNPFVLF